MSKNFNSHAHEGRDKDVDVSKYITINFNSHAHEGRDDTVLTSSPFLKISTHTPTRGVTNPELLEVK